jgi:glucokinase
MLLAGDIGGTKTSLAIYSDQAGLRDPLAEATLPSANYPSLEALAQDFLKSRDLHLDRASFGVAGPVVEGRAQITNLPWLIDATEVGRALSIPSVRLLNDLTAIAYAVPHLAPDDLHTVNDGSPASGGALAVIAPGTGLGEAFLVHDGRSYRAFPSEGGHGDFAPTTPLQVDLLTYVQERLGHVSYERVCSGRGLPNIYAFLKERGLSQEQEWLADQLAAQDDPVPLIVNTGVDGSSQICVDALDLFLDILAAEAGNLVLKVLATGGVFIGGGIPPRILSILNHERFMGIFTDKGRFAELLARVPVHIILNPKVALLGAAVHGLELWDDA